MFGSHVGSVIPPVAISLFTLLAVEAELSSMNLHVPFQFTFIAQQFLADWTLHFSTNRHAFHCVVLQRDIASSKLEFLQLN